MSDVDKQSLRDALGPLPEPDMQADPCSADGTQTDYFTAGTVRRLLATERERGYALGVAAERERCERWAFLEDCDGYLLSKIQIGEPAPE